MTPGISRFRYLLFFGLLALALSALVGAATQATASVPAELRFAVPHDGTENLPPGAAVQTVLPSMVNPIALAFDPAGRLFYTEKTTGRVRLFENGVLQATPVITFSVTSTGEQGLLGIAIDPDFNTNHYIYVYYTCACTPLENRVVRFVETNGVGSSPTTIFTSPNGTDASNHNGGNIHFGPDGNLYVSLGDDGATPSNSQNVQVKQGKIHRMDRNGQPAPGGPVFTQTGALPTLYAMGLRNSFDFSFDPLTPGRIFASENGPGCDDELNRIEAGYNYGWRPSYPCDDPNPSPTYNTIAPLWFLGSGACCEAPTGIMVYSGYQVPQWTNDLFMVTYNGAGTLRHFYLNAQRTQVITTNVVLGVTPNMDLITGPDGAFYFIDGGGYSTGTLYKIVGPGGTQTPTSVASSTVAATVTRTATRTATAPPTITSTPCPGAMNTQVDIIDYAYIPPIQTIHVGDTIYWTNSGAAPHTATSDTGVWDSGSLANGDEFSFTFTTPGDYEYHCAIHPFMTGTISVLAGCGTTPTTVPATVTTTRTATPILPTVTGTPPTATATPIASNTSVASNTPLNTAVASSTPVNTPEVSPTVPEATFTAIPSSTVTSLPGVTGTVTVAVSTNTPMPTATTCSLRFMDVPPANTFYPFVQCLACRGIIGGYPCGTVTTEPCNAARDPYFRPNNNITRGQIAKIVSESARFSENPGAQIYEDVPSGNTFYAWINRLSMRGYMGGYPCGTVPAEPCGSGDRPYFRPNANATRGQLAKIVSNAAGFAEGHTDQIFTDVAQDNPFYIWIERLASRGVMSGYPCGTLPQETCDNQNRPYFRWANEVTRGQASKIVSNTFFPNCQDPTPTSTPIPTNTSAPTNTSVPTSTAIPTNTSMPTSTPMADVDVTIENFEFTPQNITVTVGSTVRWTNLDLDYHTVTSCLRDPKTESCSPSGAFDSGHIDQNEQWQFTFNSLSPGTYEYYCIPHPYMTGTVTLLPVLVR